MAENTQQDPFGKLPEELRIKIIKLSPNPFALRNLAHASPAMGRVLDRYALEIVEEVMEATVPVQTRRLMDAVLKARFSDFFASMPEAQTIAEADWVFATENIHSSGRDQAAAAVRSLLASAANVHAWSHACLEHLIRKSMQLRPSTLIKLGRGPGRTHQEEFENAESQKDYIPQETGPPSWVEEQRMMKSFWRLQFLLELQGAGHEGRLDAIWPRQEIDALSQSSADDFYDIMGYEQEMIFTARDFLDAVTSGSVTSVESDHHNAYSLPTIRWVEGAVSRCCCAEPLYFEMNKDIFDQGADKINSTFAYRFWCAMTSKDDWLYGMFLRLWYPFQTWRKYGFAIWDDKRMVDLGMRNPRRSHFGANSISYSFRWWSMLTEEEKSQPTLQYRHR